MKKLYRFFSIGIADQLSWQAGFIISIVSAAIGWGVLVIFWRAVYSAGNTIGTYTLSDLIFYYTFSTILQIVFDRGFFWNLSDVIYNGELSNYLLKPVSFFTFQMWYELGARVAALMRFSIPIIIALIVFWSRIPHTLHAWVWIFIALVMGYFCHVYSGFIAATTTPWLKSQYAPVSTYFSIAILLSGQMIPLSIMPVWLQTVARWSPFPYITSYPLEMMLGRKIIFTPQEFAIGIAWIAVLWCGAIFMWKRAAIRYEAVGS